ncbi:hypothetical protein, partial [Paractinoplanes ferrugineus]
MRLTEHQLASTALRIVAERLNDLVTPGDLEDWVVDEMLSEQHCPDRDCDREDVGGPSEVDQVRAKMRRAVAYLREELDVYAMNQGV